jgi:hypothetical protein
MPADSQSVSEDPPISQPALCPHCEKPIFIQPVAHIGTESRMVFTLEPTSGELLTMKNVGSAIEQMAKIMEACGRDIDVPTITMVERIDTNESGKISIHMLIARFDRANQIKKRHRAVRNAG